MGMQAQVHWQWLRHTQLKAQNQGKPLLLINIDETPIPYHIKPVTGVVKKGFGGQIAVSTNEKRGTASLLATVCVSAASHALLFALQHSSFSGSSSQSPGVARQLCGVAMQVVVE